MATFIQFVFRNKIEAIRKELSRGADPNERDEDGRTPLIHAAIDNQLEIAGLLLTSRAEVNSQDDLGNSALHYAAQDYHPAMAALLIRNGASVDAQDVHGNSPLWRAVFNSRGRGEIILLLLKAGADKERRNTLGKTPFDLAKIIANYDIIQFFS